MQPMNADTTEFVVPRSIPIDAPIRGTPSLKDQPREVLVEVALAIEEPKRNPELVQVGKVSNSTRTERSIPFDSTL